MAYDSLRDFIAAVEAAGLLRRVRVPVHPHLEMTEIVDRLCKSGGDGRGPGPAVMFEQPVGCRMPVLMNAFGSEERMAMALGVKRLDDIGDRIRELVQLPSAFGPGMGFLDKLKVLPKLAGMAAYLPKTVSTGPCKEVILKDGFSLFDLPVLKCWPDDGGAFVTLPLVFTRDPETGVRNVGMYRMQVYDERTTGMHWHVHKDGARHHRRALGKGGSGRLEVAVAIGADPAVVYAATAPLPSGIDELLFAGFLRQSPVKMVKCETVDLEVPASSEIVLEGYVELGELRREGPFGDHTGFYSLADDYPVFHVTCMTRRADAIYMATVVGRPPMEDCFMGKATERIFLPLLQLQLPEVVDMHLPFEGVFHNCAVISIDKEYPGHAQKVMHAVWGMGQMMFTKVIIVVDKDVDIQDLSTAAWHVLSNTDPGRDITIVKGPVDALDHASPLPHLGTKMGIDATRKWPSEGFAREWPEPLVMAEDVRERVTSRWKEYGLD